MTTNQPVNPDRSHPTVDPIVTGTLDPTAGRPVDPHVDRGGPAPMPSVATRGGAGLPRPGQWYTHTLRTDTARWWKPLVGILGGVVVLFVASVIATLGAMAFEAWRTGTTLDVAFGSGMRLTPTVLAAALLALVSLIPLSWVLVRFLHGQPWGWHLSVEGRLRWAWLLRLVCALLVVFTVYMAVFLRWAPQRGERETDWLWFVGVSVALMPFQAAAEEIFFRGYVQRAVGSWFAADRVAFVAGTAVSALLFMAAHGALDLWLNLYYLMFGVTLSIAARLGGGLEIPIALHVVNNVVSGAIGAATQDMDSAFDRSAGVGGPFMLVQIVFVALCSVACVWWARRRGVRTRVPDPAAAS